MLKRGSKGSFEEEVLFTYSTEHLQKKDKVRFYYALKGRDGKTGVVKKYRIDHLVENKVIKGFKPLVDMKQLGYTSYKVDMNLDSLENQQRMEDYLLKNPNVSNIIRTIGWADLEIKVYARSCKEFRSVMCTIRDEFPDDLRYYDFFEYPETIKESFMPVF